MMALLLATAPSVTADVDECVEAASGQDSGPQVPDVQGTVQELRERTLAAVECIREEASPPGLVVTFSGPAAGTWSKSLHQPDGVLPPGEYPAVGHLVLNLVYNCGNVAGQICGNFAYADALGHASCGWVAPGPGDGSIVSLAVGSSDGGCSGSLDGFLILCEADASISTNYNSLSVSGIGICTIAAQQV